ncbi:unnamed protein product, partial [Nesidiocoris tenuis]
MDSSASVVEEQMSKQQEFNSSLIREAMNLFKSRIHEYTTTPVEICKFDGYTMASDKWLQLYENMCRINHWIDDSQKVMYLQTNLENGSIAEKWYNSRIFNGQMNESWASWKVSFVEAFKQHPIELMIKADDFNYSSGSLLDYYYEKERLIDLAYGHLPVKVKILMIIKGLPSSMQDQLLMTDVLENHCLINRIARLKPFQEKQDSILPIIYKETPIEVGACRNVDCSRICVGEMKINGKVFSGLFDSGAAVDLLKYKFVEENCWELEETSNVLIGFNQIPQKFTFSARVKFEKNGKAVESRAVVCENLGYNFIVSWPTLQKLGFALDQVIDQKHEPKLELLNVTKRFVKSKEDVLKYFPEVKGEVSLKLAVPFALRDDSPIVALKPYRLSRERYMWAQTRIKELLDQKIIRESTSKYASPCVIVPKANGSLRLCQDYREVNKHTDLDPFPFPIIDDLICQFGGCKFFSNLDLKDGFHQVPLTEETKQYTSFVLPFGQYEFNKLPFGWKNSPSHFQRFMTRVLGDLLHDPNICVYIDDILIGGRTEDECATKNLHGRQASLGSK